MLSILGSLIVNPNRNFKKNYCQNLDRRQIIKFIGKTLSKLFHLAKCRYTENYEKLNHRKVYKLAINWLFLLKLNTIWHKIIRCLNLNWKWTINVQVIYLSMIECILDMSVFCDLKFQTSQKATFTTVNHFLWMNPIQRKKSEQEWMRHSQLQKLPISCSEFEFRNLL